MLINKKLHLCRLSNHHSNQDVEKFLDFGKKYFAASANLVFILALFIIGFQLIQSGFSYFQANTFTFWYKSLNLVFSLYACLISLYLFAISDSLFIRVARTFFLIVSLAYLFMSVFWFFNLLHNQFDVESYRSFLALFVGFIGISFKVSALGDTRIHPALIFVLSFFLLILFGTFALLLPEAANKNIDIVQALFTATSAVTVTGLAVLDTGKDFTFLGQTIIVVLIQLGGLGVLTVTNIFALVFKSSSSFRNRFMVSDMIKELDNSKTFHTLFKIVLITLLVELVGAILIYVSICNQNVSEHPVFFSIFHAVSAFCNGGFSTLTNSLYEESVRFNYFLQIVICWLIITGGLGYTVMINHYAQIKNFILAKLSGWKLAGIYYTRELHRTSTNSRIVLVTTGILLLAGTVLFLSSEYDGVLKEHNLFGKIVVSFFNSTTPRTAGFNNVNMAELGLPAIMLTMALMWIGASPGSTGGGIKTTTFTITLLNLWNQIKGKDKLIIKKREIPHFAVNQVNAVVILSIFAVSFGTFMLAMFEPKILFKDLLFEVISAYSTVGLSVGITPALTEKSHITLIIIMFLGRVSFLTFLIALFNRIFGEEKGVEPYYPKENVFIN